MTLCCRCIDDLLGGPPHNDPRGRYSDFHPFGDQETEPQGANDSPGCQGPGGREGTVPGLAAFLPIACTTCLSMKNGGYTETQAWAVNVLTGTVIGELPRGKVLSLVSDTPSEGLV